MSWISLHRRLERHTGLLIFGILVVSSIGGMVQLLPIVAGQGGNTGAQSLAVVIRGIALRGLGSGTSRRVIFKTSV